MAIAVQSVGTSSGYGTTAVITKPTGLAEGDLMIALLEANDTGVSTGTTINVASGWTQATSVNGGGFLTLSIQYKIASTSDVSASNFTFTDTLGNRIGGAILRADGHASVGFFDLATSATNVNTGGDATPAFTISQTPAYDNSLVVILIAGGSSGAGLGTMSGYAATPAITFTEAFDQGVDSGTLDPHSGGAYGILTTAAEITEFRAVSSIADDDQFGAIAVFTPRIDAQGTNALLSVSPTHFSQAGVAGGNGTNALLEVSPTIPTQSGQATSPTQWTNEATESTEWTNEQSL